MEKPLLSTRKRCLIALTAPQSLAQCALDYRRNLAGPFVLPAPMPPLLPVFETEHPPKPPVTGLLPPCKGGIGLDAEPQVDDSGWILWPTNTNGWITDLAAALRGENDDGDRPELFPLRLGIPLAIVLGRIGQLPPLGKPPSWRALVLTCWSVDFSEERPWYRGALWRTEWRRRLKRAQL